MFLFDNKFNNQGIEIPHSLEITDNHSIIIIIASVAKYEDSWWRQNNGIPTGGSLCVQIANITVYYVMSIKVY